MSCHSRLFRAALLGVALLGAACSNVPLGVYRVDVQQGNVLTEEMLAQLTPGMDKRKVRFLLGTPILVDTFNQDRWDYIYTLSRGGGTFEQRQVTLFFEDERLARIEGDVHRGDGSRKIMPGETLVLVPEEQRSKGFMDVLRPRLDFLDFGDDAEPAAPEPATAASETEGATNEDATRMAEPAVVTPGAEEIETGGGVSDSEAPEATRVAGEDDEGWFRNFLQYLDDAVSTPRADGAASSSLPDSEPDRQ
jgi:outer membrane protein assembly factor BamE